ncbi:MAG: hypothetical protein OHK0039_31880 [Bacteroidia bacterium]
MYRNILMITMLGLVLLGCERELEIPLPEHQPRLVANCLAVSGAPFQVFVSRSYGLNEGVREYDIYLTDAEVRLWRNGVLEEVLTYEQGTPSTYNSFGYVSRHLAQPATHYLLEVRHPDYPELRQEMVMPGLPQVSAPTFLVDVGLDRDGMRTQRLYATLRDAPDSVDAYCLAGFYFERSLDSSRTRFPLRGITCMWYPSGNELTYATTLGYLLPDRDFAGQTVRLGFDASFVDGLSPDSLYVPAFLVLERQSWNQPAYRLASEYADHVSAYRVVDMEILFASQSALPMYSNAEGGYGVFGGYVVQRDTLWL